jgi:hypothetical protein
VQGWSWWWPWVVEHFAMQSHSFTHTPSLIYWACALHLSAHFLWCWQDPYSHGVYA